MSGKWFIAVLLISSLVAGYVIREALKRSPDNKSLATEQMKLEFFNYADSQKKGPHLSLAKDQNVDYFVDLSGAEKDQWNFELQDKTLVVSVPHLQSAPPQPTLKSEIVQSATKSLQSFVAAWMEEKFQTQKDLLVKIHFGNAAP